MIQLTKELKQNWINALKSGKYIAAKSMLRDENGRYCCLGVLTEIHPTWSISVEGNNVVVNGIHDGYHPFETLMEDDVLKELYRCNDKYVISGGKDYAEVIPLIEKLPTID